MAVGVMLGGEEYAIRECRDEPAHPTTLCVSLHFGNGTGSTGDASIACIAESHKETLGMS